MIWESKLRAFPLAKHVAIIMDGNGRWAAAKRRPRLWGHRHGAQRVKDIVKMAKAKGVDYLTLYAFSAENWSRPDGEVAGLMKLLVRFCRSEARSLHEAGVRLRTIGDLSQLPEVCRQALGESIELTKANEGLTLTLALNYGAKQDLVGAVKGLCKDVAAGLIDPNLVSQATIASRLSTSFLPAVDLVIRTSGEQRLSNFLLFESAYAELYFTDIHWPDFDGDQFQKALESFGGRERRYGGLGGNTENASL